MKEFENSSVKSGTNFELKVYKYNAKTGWTNVYSEVSNSSIVQYKATRAISMDGFQSGNYKLEIMKTSKKEGVIGKFDFC